MFAALLLCCSAPPAAPAALTGPEARALAAEFASPDVRVSTAAAKKLIAAGPGARAAVPALVTELERGNRVSEVIPILAAIGPGAKDAVPALFKQLACDPNWGHSVERIAVAITAIDGPKPEVTRALLMSNGKGGSSYLPHSQVLQSHPADVVRHLCALCADTDAKARVRAARALAVVGQPEVAERLGDAAKPVPTVLERVLTDPDSAVRASAARSAALAVPELADKAVSTMIELAKSGSVPQPRGPGSDPESDVPAALVFEPVPARAAAQLLPLFDSANDELREWAVRHAAALPVRPQLEALLKDGSTPRARAGAARALGSQTAAGVPALKAALNDTAFAVRFAAAESLTSVGGEGSRATGLPALVEGLSAADANTRERARRLLLGLRAAAKPAIPDVQKLLKGPVREVRFVAALALVGIDAPSAAPAVPALTEALRGTGTDPRRAAQALGDLGPVAKAAVPELVKHFDSADVHLRIASASATVRIDAPRAPDAVKVLVGVLEDPKLGVPRVYAVQALAKIGPPAKAAVPVLTRLLADKDQGPPAEIAVALIAIDPESAPARAWVRQALAARPDSEDTYDLFNALRDEPAARAALVPDLIPLLGAKDTFSRLRAAEALGAAGPAARAALPKLKEMAEKDPATAARRAAKEAVTKIESK